MVVTMDLPCNLTIDMKAMTTIMSIFMRNLGLSLVTFT